MGIGGHRFLIVFDQVTHGYGQRGILNHFSWTSPSQGLVLLLGESGSGKTTFLRLIQGLKPQMGSIIVDGVLLQKLSLSQRLSLRQHLVHTVRQQSELLKAAMVEELIQQVMRLHCVLTFPHAWFQQEIPDVKKHQTIATLSRGQQQRLAVLLATLGKPKIILLDEPLDGLDGYQKQRLAQLIKRLSLQHLVIVATHHAEYFSTFAHERLVFPQPSSQLDSTSKKVRMMHEKSLNHAFSWSFLWQYHQRVWRRNKQGISTLLPTFILLLMVLIGSTSMYIHTYVQTWAKTMIGGDYQWLEPLYALDNHSSVPSEEEIEIFSAYHPHASIQKDFDTTYFDTFFPRAIGFLENGGFQTFIPGFSITSLLEVNYVGYAAPFPHQQMTLLETEMLLGVPPALLTFFSTQWGLFPTFETVDRYVQTRRPLVYFSIQQPRWNYDNELALEIVGIFAYDHFAVFHSRLDYPTHLLETMLRFPTSPMDAVPMETHIPYTYRILQEDRPSFINAFLHDPFYHGWDLQKKDDWSDRLWKHSRPISLQKPPHDGLREKGMVHSQLGYQFLPKQWMQGFMIPLFWTKVSLIEAEWLDAFQSFTLLEWLATEPPPETARSHLYLGAQASVTLNTYDATLAWNQVGISRSLATLLNVQISEELHLSLFLDTFRIHTNIPIDYIIEQENFVIYLSPLQWEYYLLLNTPIGSSSLQPENYAYFGDEPIDLQDWIQTEPLQQLSASIQQLRFYFNALLLGLTLLFLIPSLFLFLQQFLHQLEGEIDALVTLAHDGFSQNDLHLFMDVKLMHLCFILFLSVSFSFIPLDGLLQSLWASQLGMRDSYAFPWVIFLILGMGFVGFFGLGRKLVLYEVSPQIQKLW